MQLFFSGKYMEILCQWNISIHIPSCQQGTSVHCNITLLGACFPRNPESPMRMGSDDFHSVGNRVLFLFDVFLWMPLGLLRIVKCAWKSANPWEGIKPCGIFAYHIYSHYIIFRIIHNHLIINIYIYINNKNTDLSTREFQPSISWQVDKLIWDTHQDRTDLEGNNQQETANCNM